MARIDGASQDRTIVGRAEVCIQIVGILFYLSEIHLISKLVVYQWK